MSAFVYYVPDGADESPLADRFEGRQHRCGGNGPDGRHGTFVAAADRCEAAAVRYRPHEQRWTTFPPSAFRLPPSAPPWLGVISAEMPGPADLVRTRPLPGHWIELADGRQWLLPVARGQGLEDGRLVWYHALPRAMVLAGGAWQEGPVVPPRVRLWKLAEAWWQARTAAATEEAAAGDRIEFDFQHAAAAAVECLAANYRVGGEEISLLGLFDTDSPRKILDALIDWPTLVRLAGEMKKKTEAGTSPARAG